MATVYSDQITNSRATPPVMNDSAGAGGKLRIANFTYTGDVAQNDLLELVRLPKGARIQYGRIDFTDFGTSVTLDIGDGTTENKYASAVDIATAAGQADFANTWALYGLGREQLSANITLTAKFEAANPDSGTLRGYIVYSVE